MLHPAGSTYSQASELCSSKNMVIPSASKLTEIANSVDKNYFPADGYHGDGGFYWSSMTYERNGTTNHRNVYFGPDYQHSSGYLYTHGSLNSPLDSESYSFTMCIEE